MQEPYKDENAQIEHEGSSHEEPGDFTRNGHDAPEPPPSWRPTNNQNQNSYNHESRDLHQAPSQQDSFSENLTFVGKPPDFERIRKLISISQICAVISLFIGGVVLGAVALAFGIMGYRAIISAARHNTLEYNYIKPLRQSCIIALVMSVCSLTVNIIALVYVYPLVMEALNTGDFATLFGGGAQSGSSTGTGSTTWG